MPILKVLFSDKLFAVLRQGVRDRNATVRKQFGSAMSYLYKFVSPNQVSTLMEMVRDDLVGDNGIYFPFFSRASPAIGPRFADDQKNSVRVLLKSFADNCPEVFTDYSASLIPYIFLEKCKPGRSSVFAVWSTVSFSIVIPGDEVSKSRSLAWNELWNEIVPSGLL